MRAIEVLREANRKGSARLPPSAPTDFVRQRWAAYVLPSGEIDRRHCELCVLSELRGRLQAGDVWVGGSRQYRSFEERLISKETLQNLQQAGALPVTAEPDFHRFIETRRALLDARLTAVNARARDGLLTDVTINRGVLKVAPVEKSTPPEAEVLAARLYAMLPRIRITDLLAEVAGWTLFPDCFTHLRTGEVAADSRTLLAGLLADGLNLGLIYDPHGRSLQRGQPRPARLDVGLAHPRGNLSRLPRTSALARHHRRTGSSSKRPASAATPAASMPITASVQASRSTRIYRTATGRSSPS